MSAARLALVSTAHCIQEIKKSKFAANAAPVATPDAALEFLAAIADPDATHNCWAYRVGQHYRFNDDGEPSGTAGKPILQAIDGQQVDNVIVVVTRWFGGIKLGAGGLMRAYGGCASECLRQAPKTVLIETVQVQFALEFSVLAVLQSRLHELDAKKLHEDFAGDGVTLQLSLPATNLDRLRRLLTDLSRGRTQLRVMD